jgi:hypothetical protein
MTDKARPPRTPTTRFFERAIARFSFTVDDTTVVEVLDSSPLDGRSGGVFFYHAEPGTFGVFGDFEMVPRDAN